MLPMIKRIDGRTVSFMGETMKNVMNGIVAVVGLGGTSYYRISLRKKRMDVFFCKLLAIVISIFVSLEFLCLNVVQLVSPQDRLQRFP